jgi:amiloride-sensitive sodium channel
MGNIDKSVTWNAEKGYDPRFEGSQYPDNPEDSGDSFKGDDLLVFINITKDTIDDYCEPASHLHVTLDDPVNYPHAPKKNSIQIPIEGNLYQIVMKRERIRAQDRLRYYPYTPETRKCYFQNERQLKFFKMYTRQNCELECWTETIRKECGCVEGWLPRENGTPICGESMFNCTKSVFLRVFMKKICNCLPSCNTLRYDFDFLQPIPMPMSTNSK